MFELLPPCQGVGGAGLDAKSAEGAHRQVVDVLVDDADLFALLFDPFRDHFDGAVRAIVVTDTAPGAAMLVLLVMRHNDLALEPVEHYQFLPVLRILLRYDLPRAEEVSSRDAHPDQQRSDAAEHVGEVFYETAHSRLKMPTH